MDIRQSDITTLEERVKKLSYQRYLSSLRMENVRSFTNQTITFEFPVTAIIGTNGGGKSTILGAAALAYQSVKPGQFFPKSNIGDNSMANWKISYEILDRSINNTAPFSRNARFVSAKWRRDKIPDREVVAVPIQRTVPANELAKFKQFIGIMQKTDVIIDDLPETITRTVSRILGKDASKYQRVILQDDPSRSILVGMRNLNDYSQFHFGAGEASIIEMVTNIEDSDGHSLILIEEIENGLHPLATRKMVEYLFDVAKRKKSQIIFTTHSEHALDALPPKAIWACIDGTAYQGKLSIESLRALTGSVEKDSVIFVEDDFAKDLVEEMLRQYALPVLDKIQVHKAGGFPYVVDVLKHHRDNPTVKHKAIAMIDGDNPSLDKPDDDVLVLPEGVPESIVYQHVLENVEACSALIQQRCQCPSVSQDTIVAAIQGVSFDTTDPHLLYSKLGERLGFISEIIVRRGLCSIYVQQNAAIIKPIVENARRQLNI